MQLLVVITLLFAVETFVVSMVASHYQCNLFDTGIRLCCVVAIILLGVAGYRSRDQKEVS